MNRYVKIASTVLMAASFSAVTLRASYAQDATPKSDAMHSDAMKGKDSMKMSDKKKMTMHKDHMKNGDAMKTN